jgi:hypothetical protein
LANLTSNHIPQITVLFFLIRIVGGWSPYWVHSGRRPLNGLLYLPRVIVMMENLLEWRLEGETEVHGENLPQRHFVHHKSQLTRPGLEPRAAAVGSQRLTAWTMARPQISVLVLSLKLEAFIKLLTLHGRHATLLEVLVPLNELFCPKVVLYGTWSETSVAPSQLTQIGKSQHRTSSYPLSRLPPSGETCKHTMTPITHTNFRKVLCLLMFLSTVSLFVVALPSSEVPEGLKNYSVHQFVLFICFRSSLPYQRRTLARRIIESGSRVLTRLRAVFSWRRKWSCPQPSSVVWRPGWGALEKRRQILQVSRVTQIMGSKYCMIWRTVIHFVIMNNWIAT